MTGELPGKMLPAIIDECNDDVAARQFEAFLFGASGNFCLLGGPLRQN